MNVIRAFESVAAGTIETKGALMTRTGKRCSLLFGSALLISAVSCGGPDPEVGLSSEEFLSQSLDSLPNNFPILNGAGFAAAVSAAGFIDFTNEFNTPQGTNGRSCVTCHAFQAGWGIRPADANLLFLLTNGTHPLFNILDANTPTSDVSTVPARWASYSMLRQGKFLRLRKPPVTTPPREFEVVAANDPFSFGTTTDLLFFRRPPPTANFRSPTVMWDAANTVGTDLRAGLVKQARSNVTGAQQGMPATDEVINAIVDQELGFSHAQLYMWGAGRLDEGGAHGGPQAAAAQPLVSGRFDLYDAWIGSGNPKRAQIARGQELFNNVNPPSGRRCGGCHTAANNGQSVNGTLFDVGTSSPAVRKPDMAVYTLQRTGTTEMLETTDPGKGFVSGLWADLNRFKTPNIRGLASRAPYFHNGIADTLTDVIHHYETALGFDFTPAEEADLVAFLTAL